MAKTIKLSDIIPSRFAHLTPANEENIERIRADLVEGSKVMLNEPHVIREGGKYELLAGHDRVEAARRAGWKEVQVREFITLLTDDAILAHFCRENLLRKEISKAAIAGEWLRKHPDWSDGKVAAESGCTPVHVGETRAELVAAGKLVSTPNRLGVDGRTRQAPAEPRQPKKGALSRGTKKPTPAQPRDVAGEMLARAEAMRIANLKPAQPPSEAEHEAPDDTSGGRSPDPVIAAERTSTGHVPAPASQGGARSEQVSSAVPTQVDDESGSVIDRSKSTQEDGDWKEGDAPVEPSSANRLDVPPVSGSAVREGVAVWLDAVLSGDSPVIGKPEELRAVLSSRPSFGLVELKARIRVLQSVALQWEIVINAAKQSEAA